MKRMRIKNWSYIMLGILIVVIIAAFAFVALRSSLHSNVSPSEFVIQLTDPPSVPNGTQSLVMTYSEISLHENGSSIINIPSSGTVNLTALNNRVQTVAIAQNSANTSINGVEFTITSAYMKINGTTYQLAVPQSSVAANISTLANGSIGGILIQISPTVTQIYNLSAGTSFTMETSAKAIVLSKDEVNSSGTGYVGANASLGSYESASLASISPRVSLSGISLISSGDSTHIALSVTNNGNSSVLIKGITLSGYMLDNSSTTQSVNSTPSNSSSKVSSGGLLGLGLGASANSTTGLNGSILGDTHISSSANAIARLYIGEASTFQSNYHNTLSFLVNSSAAVALPRSESQLNASYGYLVEPHQSITLSYDGTAYIGSSSSLAMLIANQTYSVEVIGSDGAIAVGSSTAISAR